MSGSAGVHLRVMNALIIYFIIRLVTHLQKILSFCVCSCSVFTLVQNLYFRGNNILLSITVPDNLWPSVTHNLERHLSITPVSTCLCAATSAAVIAGLFCFVLFFLIYYVCLLLDGK